MNTAEPLPTATDYLTAIQRPRDVFVVPDLKGAQFEQGVIGLKGATGNNAVVTRASIGGKTEALRFFTKYLPPNQRQYKVLRKYVRQHRLVSVAAADLIPNAIKVNGRLWPVMRMEWVGGRPLDRYVEFLTESDDKESLKTLAETWRQLLAELQNAEFAHGDLQHGNVMIDNSSCFRLIDLDSVWIPPLAGAPPQEVGHANYQHPGRISSAQWGRFVDTFSAMVIYLSLRALALEPHLWAEFNDDDNLIFKASDFQEPFDSPVWKRLADLSDPNIDWLCDALKFCCKPTGAWDFTLKELLEPTVTTWRGVPVSRDEGGITNDWWAEGTETTMGTAHKRGTEDVGFKRLPGIPWPIVVSAANMATSLPPPPPAASETVNVQSTAQFTSNPPAVWWTSTIPPPTKDADPAETSNTMAESRSDTRPSPFTSPPTGAKSTLPPPTAASPNPPNPQAPRSKLPIKLLGWALLVATFVVLWFLGANPDGSPPAAEAPIPATGESTPDKEESTPDAEPSSPVVQSDVGSTLGDGNAPGTIISGVSVRSEPSLSSTIVGSIAENGRVTIICTARGDWVEGFSGSTNLWNRLEEPAGFASDAFINTGSNDPVAPTCLGY